MSLLHLDTHVVVWLAQGHHRAVPKSVRDRLESEPVAFSPMVRFELSILYELGRIAEPGPVVLSRLAGAMDLREDATPFSAVASAAQELTWTRDPFDRLIVAQAIAGFGVLVTKDRLIREKARHFALWS